MSIFVMTLYLYQLKVGLCLSGVLPDGVWSEWGYAQWGFVCLPYGMMIIDYIPGIAP